MADPTPAAPAAVPEAVLRAIRLFEDATVQRAEVTFSQPPTKAQQDKYVRAFRASRDADSMLEYEIATALREATEMRDQEIARHMRKNAALMDSCDAKDAEIERLTAELAAAKADTARLDWMAMQGRPIEMRGCADTVGMHYGLMAAPEVPLREAIDAARAAGDEP